MKVSRISDHIHYIGVNDRTTSRFEAMWPLPYGVSYNSYLITGADKTAIVDGVEACYALRQIEHIRDIIGDRKPDYLIINHMEPDHSGAIKMLRDAYPDIVIVGNAQTLAMVNGFYGVADKTLAVKDGDTLSLGADVNLRFTLTPMVHWPETMMTYFVEEETLFSGDAFGCFGALAGAVVDSDMDTSRYFPEMVRYYSSIVGKYGLFVQKALRKFDNVAVRTLCTTHGPVWRDRISEVVGIYDRLSLYEPLDNGVTVIYGSMYGNTELMAETAAEALAEAGIREIDVHNASVSDLSFMLSDIFRHRGLVIAAPTYSDTLFPPVRNVMEAIATRGVKNRDVLLIGSCTWGQKAVGAMNSYIESIGAVIAAEPIAFKQAPTAVQLQQCRDAACALAGKLLQ
ncbi:FprA family A-type flavoprotein [uncultured Duncaniella sp.]|jgi:flavorubredoxin|uniref:FprA family A-type flavoprotein n=1 Tax=uncultured Duncaniella sp. TaxID=2768039 RepID=UPI0025B25795|nr:FprA family A-type flavoprotein [uncultured Duncaniella sp.]